MLDSVFTSVLDVESSSAATLTVQAYLCCTLASLLLGVAIAFIYMFRHEYTKNFVVTLALLPLVVQTVITLVNGNLGAGIAVMGVFNLVRFRSIAGSAKDICAVFLAMAVGLATGMGYISLAISFTVIVGIANVAFMLSPLGKQVKKPDTKKMLRVTIPEDLDYCEIFDDLFDTYTNEAELVNVKTTNMGSLYQLEYHIDLKDPASEKKLLDEIRCRNGNLGISCGRVAAEKETL